MEDSFVTNKELQELEKEHKELDLIINDKEKHQFLDELTIMRIKKRKLILKDQITSLKSSLYPNIIA